MWNKLLSCLILLAACHDRVPRAPLSPATAKNTATAKTALSANTGFSRLQLTGPDYIQADSIPYGSDTIFSTSLRCISDTPLVIFKTEGSCICTTVNLPTPVTLKKGQVVRLPIRYNTHLKGPFSQNILVFNNTETNPLVIYIKGVIR